MKRWSSIQHSGSLSSDWCLSLSSVICLRVSSPHTVFFFSCVALLSCDSFPSIHPESGRRLCAVFPSSHCNTSMWPRWRTGVSLQVIESPPPDCNLGVPDSSYKERWNKKEMPSPSRSSVEACTVCAKPQRSLCWPRIRHTERMRLIHSPFKKNHFVFLLEAMHFFLNVFFL